MKKILFYDCEIAKCIPSRNEYLDDRYEYCEGWDDKQGMGIACICTYTSWAGYEVYLVNQLKDFLAIASQADEVIGFNSIDFDDNLLAENRIHIKTTYDLLCEVRIASGQPPHYTRGVTRGGYNLEQCSLANLGRGKTGVSEEAPKLWQQGSFKEVISYCFNGVDLLQELYEKRSRFIDPTNGNLLFLRDGDRLEYWVAMWNRKANLWKQAVNNYFKRWRVLIQAIPKVHFSEYQIIVRSPISIKFRPPMLDAWVSCTAIRELNKSSSKKHDEKIFDQDPLSALDPQNDDIPF